MINRTVHFNFSKEKETVENGHTKPPAPADCLPEPLEAMRLAFIKDCMPWR